MGADTPKEVKVKFYIHVYINEKMMLFVASVYECLGHILMNKHGSKQSS